MAKEGQKTITIGGIKLKKIQSEYENVKKTQPNISFAGFVADSTIYELDRKKILKESQLLSLISLDDNMIYLKDGRPKRQDRLIEVQVKNKKLFCLSDESDECIHVGFATALPEIIRALE